MNREEFNSCISSGMAGKTFTKDQRKLEFCVLAKQCAGKVKSREEAIAICNQPKPPKPEGEKKHRRSRKEEPECECNSTMFIAQCESKAVGMVKDGSLPADTDISGLCQLILG